MLNREMRIEFFNRSFQQLFNLQPRLDAAIEFAQRVAEQVGVAASPEPFTVEYDEAIGDTGRFAVTARSLRDWDKNLITIRPLPVSARESSPSIEDNRRSEQERDQFLMQQTALLEAAGEGIFGLDSNGNCSFINPVACRMLGYTPDECLGQNMHALSHYKRADGSPFPREECPAYRALLLGRGSRVDEDLIWRKDGSSLPIRLTTEPVLIHGLVSGAVVTMSDITGQKVAEAEVAKKAEELARSNAELQRFAYLAAHDLREPIHTVAGFADLLRQHHSEALGCTAKDYLSRISNSAERMSEMIRALLAYAEVNERPVFSRPVDCEEALLRTLEDMEATIRETGAVVIHGRLPTVVAPETQIRQLLQNLISNGIKYGRQPSIVLEVNAVEKRGEWLFSVRDNGIGIAPENLGCIFDLFHRNLRKAAPGVGIGLATCRKIVDGLGGRIWVESQVGAGSTFYFTLPATVSAATEEQALSKRPPPCYERCF